MPAILVSYRGEHPASPWYSTGRVQWDGLADAGIVLCLASIGLCLAGIVTWAPFWICGLSRASVGVGVQQYILRLVCMQSEVENRFRRADRGSMLTVSTLPVE